MRQNNYILKDKIPVECPDILEWGKWFGDSNRHVANDKLDNGIHVSTVFLGLDHNWGDGDPILFETMIFGGEHDEYQERYCTWEEAEAGHKRALKLVMQETPQ